MRRKLETLGIAYWKGEITHKEYTQALDDLTTGHILGGVH